MKNLFINYNCQPKLSTKNFFVLINKTFLLIFSILLFSCNEKKSLSNVLTKGDCFWDIYDKRYTLEANTCFKFYSDNKCEYFSYEYGSMQKRMNKVHRYNEDDNIMPDTWKIKGDTLEVRTSLLNIISYNQDTILLRYISSPDTIILSKNCTTQLIQ
ncbi:MAG: hypothetical protein WBC06_01660 [Chitinophagaceae bacterium]